MARKSNKALNSEENVLESNENAILLFIQHLIGELEIRATHGLRFQDGGVMALRTY